MADIFLSCASADRDHVVPLVRALESLGHSVWWDRQIHPELSFEDVIEAELDASTTRLLLRAPNQYRKGSNAGCYLSRFASLDSRALGPTVGSSWTPTCSMTTMRSLEGRYNKTIGGKRP